MEVYGLSISKNGLNVSAKDGRLVLSVTTPSENMGISPGDPTTMLHYLGSQVASMVKPDGSRLTDHEAAVLVAISLQKLGVSEESILQGLNIIAPNTSQGTSPKK